MNKVKKWWNDLSLNERKKVLLSEGLLVKSAKYNYDDLTCYKQKRIGSYYYFRKVKK